MQTCKYSKIKHNILIFDFLWCMEHLVATFQSDYHRNFFIYYYLIYEKQDIACVFVPKFVDLKALSKIIHYDIILGIEDSVLPFYALTLHFN